ncbi:uncharacterized protein ASCRUDRAFT_76585, partial [Ascoidea rubescens DSM 1968]
MQQSSTPSSLLTALDDHNTDGPDLADPICKNVCCSQPQLLHQNKTYPIAHSLSASKHS